MVLTAVDRGVLEKLIDRIISIAKIDAKTFADEKARKAFHIKNSEDFVFGIAYGQINSSFSGYFASFYQRQADAEELAEISDIVLRRLPEIRKAIFFEE